MGASVRTACVVGLLALACCGLPLSGQSPNPVPLINDPLEPTSVAPGGAGFTLTVNGTGFVSGSKVNWNGTALPTSFVSSSRLTASVPGTDVASAGSGWVTVTNPAPGGGTSLPAFLRIATAVTNPSFVSYSQNTIFNHSGTISLITGDFNGDGKLDLAFIGDQQGPAVSASMPGIDSFSICIELGNGDGSFQSAVCQPAYSGQGEQPMWVVAGDFNGDGKLDLAVSNSGVGAGSISVFLGNGDGTLQPPINAASGNGPLFLAVGDFNQDGKLDLVVENFDNSTPTVTSFVSVLLGNGDGTFQSPVTYASGLGVYSLVVGDFNGDGKLDLALQPGFNNSTSSTLYFLAGNGDGTFQPAIPAQTVGGDDFISAAADFNGDGKLDLFLSDNKMLTDDILLGNGNGTFQSPVSYPFATAFSICRAGVIDDLNADGKLDLAFCSGDASVAGAVGFQLGNGDGTFQAATNVVALTQAVPYPSSIVAGDFRGDGRVDLVVSMAAGASTPFSIYLQGNFPVASANPGRLTFSSQDPNTSSPAQVVTLTNTGTLPVTYSGASIGGTNAASFGQTNTCGASLAAGASCDINVTFTPTTPGQPMATLNISDSAIGSPQVVYLAGTTNGPGLTFSPPSIAFNSQYVGTSGLPQSVTLTNTGTAALSISNVATSPSDFGFLNACGGSLAAGASCAIGVFFDPTVSGTRTGTLTITDNAVGSPQTVTVTGSGQDFSVAPGATSSTTVTAGQTASYSIAVAPAGGFAQSVALSCSGGPAGSACAVSPSTIALSGAAAQTAMVTVTTVAQGSVLPFSGGSPKDTRYRQTPMILTLAVMFLLMAVASQILRREQNPVWIRVVGFAALVTLGLTLTSCGGSSGSGGGGTNPQAGTYTITVTGNFTSGATTLTHAAKLTLVVQ
jgi:FG-GAP-like repeat/Abnormal spindle-like microcephaly-assoc'd, ASPM-SPD-2-Hydin